MDNHESFSHDLECARYFEMLQQLGCYDEEFEYWGFVYLENGQRKYYITSEGKKAYIYRKKCLENNLFATPVERYFKWEQVGSGQYEKLKQENKLQFAEYLQSQYSISFMSKMNNLFLIPANNNVLPILEQLKKQLWGSFDLDGLCLFEGIIELSFETKKIRLLDYLKLQDWVRREIALCPQTQPKLKEKKVFSGFVYETESGEEKYYSNADSFLAFERKNELMKKGAFTTPIFHKNYYYGQLDEFLQTKAHYVACQQKRCNKEYVDFVKYIMHLPGVIDTEFLEQEKEAMGVLSKLEQQCLQLYSNNWLGKC